MDWIKLMCNILDNRKIKMIRKGPEGDTLVLLWLLILVEAGKCNRGGYLMVSDNLPYTAETLSMVTDIPLPTVQLGLRTFGGLDMIDQQDNAIIYVKNWRKYQSADKLEAQKEKARVRQQRHRQKERENLLALQAPEIMSRDSHGVTSRDVTQESRVEKSREEQTTTTVVAVELVKRLPREIQLDADVRAWVSEALGTKGEEYVESNIEATISQSKTNPKAYLRKALLEDYGESYRTKRKAAREKAQQAAQIVEQERERELAEAMRLQEARQFYNSLPESDREKIMAEARKTSPFKLPELVEGAVLHIVLKNYMPAGQVTCNR